MPSKPPTPKAFARRLSEYLETNSTSMRDLEGDNASLVGHLVKYLAGRLTGRPDGGSAMAVREEAKADSAAVMAHLNELVAPSATFSTINAQVRCATLPVQSAA